MGHSGMHSHGDEPDRRPPRLTRRGVLAAGVGLMVSACAGSASATRALRRPAGPDDRPATPGLTEAGSRLTRVPTLAVPPQTRPVFYLDQIEPRALPTDVALTIDDGPDPHYTPAVLAILDQFGVKATFSVVGIHANRYPDLLREIVARGHGLTNHSLTHPQPFATLNRQRLTTEIVGGLEAIYDATGVATGTFRSPGGDWSPAVYGLLGQLGMMPIDWDIDPRDYAKPGVAYITAKLLRARPHDILLCHDGGGNRSETVTALRAVLPALKARGLTFATL